MCLTRASLVAFVAAAAVLPTGLQAQLNAGNISAAAPIPLASHPQGQAMMAQAVQRTALIDVNFKFLDKSYENNTYATDPLGNKYITGCYLFKASSGFRFKVDVPQFTLTPQGVTITQNIAKINADGLAAKFRAVACHDVDVGVGLRLSDVKVTYTAKPMLSFSQNACTLSFSQNNDEVRVSIGDLNVLGVQNNIDQLAKKAIVEAINATFEAYYGTVMRGELAKVTVDVCGPIVSSGSPASSAPPTTRQPAPRTRR
jgi:hypothetical protein